MNKLKSFLLGVLLLASVFAMVFLTALIYRASERSTIKSYIFQMDNAASQRVGTLQDLEKISANELLTKLLHKYVSEYLKVIPGDANVTARPILQNLSSSAAFNTWKNGEAKTITKMSENKMFRTVEFPAASIEALNKPAGYDYYDETTVQPIYYAVHYETTTWTQPNMMSMDNAPVHEHGVLYLEAKFIPGIRETIDGKKFNIKDYLQSGKNPVGLFMFQVTNIDNKGI